MADGQSYRALEKWKCRRVDSPYKDIGNKVFVTGYAPWTDEGWLTGAIKSYRPKEDVYVTVDGDKIRLVGEPGENVDALSLWKAFCKKNRVRSEQDVSSRYVQKGK